MMHRTGAVSFSGATTSPVADGEFQGASRNGVAIPMRKQRSMLFRVLRICEGNIFGETNEDGTRIFVAPVNFVIDGDKSVFLFFLFLFFDPSLVCVVLSLLAFVLFF